MRTVAPPADPRTLALEALAAVAADPALLARFLDVTGIAPGFLRARAADPALLAALLGYLEAHEPDLISVADAAGTTPAALVAARAALDHT